MSNYTNDVNGMWYLHVASGASMFNERIRPEEDE